MPASLRAHFESIIEVAKEALESLDNNKVLTDAVDSIEYDTLMISEILEGEEL